MGATVEDAACLDAMSNDSTAAVGAGGRQRMDGAFKAVEHVRLSAHAHLKSLVVLVATHFTRGK
jgi:hypothetical protein